MPPQYSESVQILFNLGGDAHAAGGGAPQERLTSTPRIPETAT
jgi:hypothetical protein